MKGSFKKIFVYACGLVVVLAFVYTMILKSSQTDTYKKYVKARTLSPLEIFQTINSTISTNLAQTSKELSKKHQQQENGQRSKALANVGSIKTENANRHLTPEVTRNSRIRDAENTDQKLNQADSHPEIADQSHDKEKNKDQNKDQLLDSLVHELGKKLEIAKATQDLKNITCESAKIENRDSCAANSTCPRQQLPVNLRDRVKQLAFRENLQVPPKYRQVLHDMRDALPGHFDVIIVSALSSNHYMEFQAMLKNLHEQVFPLLKNFTFVVYNLGLTENEIQEVKKYCRCTLLRFPYEKFPSFFPTLKCFGWKPTVIRAHYDRANIVIWTDASIRIHNGSAVLTMIERARERGIQQRFLTRNVPNPYFTLKQMFLYFGDDPCAHMSIPQVETGYGIYHREPLVEKAILDPWFACAVRAECQCPVEQKTVQGCADTKEWRIIGMCMRNEQSGISIILGKLFREKYRHFVVNVDWFQRALRENKYDYFGELKRKELQGTIHH